MLVAVQKWPSAGRTLEFYNDSTLETDTKLLPSSLLAAFKAFSGRLVKYR